jgi:hypothetical protein
LHDEIWSSLASRSGCEWVEHQDHIATVHGRSFSYSS